MNYYTFIIFILLFSVVPLASAQQYEVPRNPFTNKDLSINVITDDYDVDVKGSIHYDPDTHIYEFEWDILTDLSCHVKQDIRVSFGDASSVLKLYLSCSKSEY